MPAGNTCAGERGPLSVAGERRWSVGVWAQVRDASGIVGPNTRASAPQLSMWSPTRETTLVHQASLTLGTSALRRSLSGARRERALC